MRIAYLGDIVGGVGVRTACAAAAHLRSHHGVGCVVANAENAARGSGLTPELAGKLFNAGCDVLTLGDHAFRKAQIRSTLEQTSPPVLRPANLPTQAWGRGMTTLEPGTGLPRDAPRVHTVVLMGRLFMNGPQADDPYACLDRALEAIHRRHDTRDVVLVEFHAEATSEKVAMGWHGNGRVTAVLGTHTHVPTADARILPGPDPEAGLPGTPSPLRGGTAYITDLGMTGPQDGVLGRRADRVLRHMTSSVPAAFDVADANPQACGVIIDTDPKTGRALAIERFQHRFQG